MIRNSIRNKLIVFLLAATILPIATSIFVTYYVTRNNVAEEAIRTNSHLMYQGKTNMINYLDIIQQASLSVYNDTALYNVIEGGSADYVSRNEIFRGLQSISNTGKDIHQVYLYVKKTNYAYLFNQGNLSRSEDQRSKRVPASGQGEIWVEPAHSSHTYDIGGFHAVPSATVITFHRSINSALTMKELGVLSIDVKLNTIRTISEQLYARGEEQFYILDAGGTVIYGPDEETEGRRLGEAWARDLLARSPEKDSFEYSGESFNGIQIYERIRTNYLDWTLVKRIPYERLYESARSLTRINALIFAAFLIVVTSATLYISFRFTAPIKKLIGYIGKIQSGNMQVDIHIKSNDEFGILARRFRLMMQTINHLITQEYKLELANKTNQLKALQAQINPHFLYNALQSIGTLALQHDAPKIYTLLSSLAKMMRYSMNTGQPLVPLKQEIDHVQAYLLLQLQRFGSGLDLVYDFDERTKGMLVPKMILQPLVENYFKHGFDPSVEAGRLNLSSRLDDVGTLVIVIEDNGRGMAAEPLEQLRRKLNRPFDYLLQQEDNIGLMNVMSRLALYYESGASMTLDVPKPSGFRVTLHVPTATEGGEADDRDHRR